jgi:DNA-binding NtrC family response regulator
LSLREGKLANEHGLDRLGARAWKPSFRVLSRALSPLAIAALHARAAAWARDTGAIVDEATYLTGVAAAAADEGAIGSALAASTPLPGGATTPAPLGAVPGKSLQARLQEQEKAEIIAAIERNTGNIAGAARALGINRSTLYYRLRKHDLEHLLPTKLDDSDGR